MPGLLSSTCGTSTPKKSASHQYTSCDSCWACVLCPDVAQSSTLHSVFSQDGEVRKAFQRSLTKQGFKFKLNTKVNGAKIEADKVTLDLESKKGEKETFEADVVLVSAGMLSPSLNKPLCVSNRKRFI